MTENLIKDSILYLMADNSKLRRARIQALLEEIGLHRGQPFILSVLWEREGITHSELAERLFVKPATITNGLKRMEKAGLVERRPDPNDQRLSRVYLTEAGWAIRQQVEAVWRRFEAETLAGFNAEERAALRRFLQRIHENLLRSP